MIKTVYCDDDDMLVVFDKEQIDFMYQILRKAKEQGLIIETENNIKTNICRFCGNGEIINLKNNQILMRERINHSMGCLIPMIDNELVKYVNNIACDVVMASEDIKMLMGGLTQIIDTVDLSSLDNIKLLQMKGLIIPLLQKISNE